MSFQDQTASFFDELSRIRETEQEVRDEFMGERGGDGAGPYSNLLTQEETPEDYQPYIPEPDDPEVILGHSPE